jgi:hypothetical protein
VLRATSGGEPGTGRTGWLTTIGCGVAWVGITTSTSDARSTIGGVPRIGLVGWLTTSGCGVAKSCSDARDNCAWLGSVKTAGRLTISGGVVVRTGGSWRVLR